MNNAPIFAVLAKAKRFFRRLLRSPYDNLTHDFVDLLDTPEGMDMWMHPFVSDSSGALTTGDMSQGDSGPVTFNSSRMTGTITSSQITEESIRNFFERRVVRPDTDPDATTSPLPAAGESVQSMLPAEQITQEPDPADPLEAYRIYKRE